MDVSTISLLPGLFVEIPMSRDVVRGGGALGSQGACVGGLLMCGTMGFMNRRAFRHLLSFQRSYMENLKLHQDEGPQQGLACWHTTLRCPSPQVCMKHIFVSYRAPSLVSCCRTPSRIKVPGASSHSLHTKSVPHVNSTG